MKLIYSVINIKEYTLYPVNHSKIPQQFGDFYATHQQTPKDKRRYSGLFKSSNQELCFQGRLVYNDKNIDIDKYHQNELFQPSNSSTFHLGKFCEKIFNYACLSFRLLFLGFTCKNLLHALSIKKIKTTQIYKFTKYNYYTDVLYDYGHICICTSLYSFAVYREFRNVNIWWNVEFSAHSLKRALCAHSLA